MSAKRFYVYSILGLTTQLRDIGNSCTVETMTFSSDPRLMQMVRDSKIISFEDIHNALTFGFVVSWRFPPCGDCEKRVSCLGYSPNICSNIAQDHCSNKPAFLRFIYFDYFWHHVISPTVLHIRYLGKWIERNTGDWPDPKKYFWCKSIYYHRLEYFSI
ncbi:uncharacterized protein LOC124929163 [Impatiens glandulifera]|uniref:uncharacterized protein LOC124929163 n=1 Tax=Impatiens glandulifera TaxID=253017 RepID=UPI001FB09CE4|nr:uncharacterized protein LOC124929163 [Impatiens glandulifera]